MDIHEAEPGTLHTEVFVRKFHDEYQATLTVGVQDFAIGPRYETQVEAQWMADQLATGITRILNDAADLVKGDMREGYGAH